MNKKENKNKKDNKNNDCNISIAMQALECLNEEQKQHAAARAQLDAQKGKVVFADAVSASQGSIKVETLAVELKQSGVEIGRSRLFEWLRGNGYVTRLNCGDNRPTQKSLDLGVMEMQEYVNENDYGQKFVRYTIRITPKGHDYFYQKVMADKDRINTIAAERRREANKRAYYQRRKAQKAS